MDLDAERQQLRLGWSCNAGAEFHCERQDSLHDEGRGGSMEKGRNSFDWRVCLTAVEHSLAEASRAA